LLAFELDGILADRIGTTFDVDQGCVTRWQIRRSSKPEVVPIKLLKVMIDVMQALVFVAAVSAEAVRRDFLPMGRRLAAQAVG
jgi:hypothetical protein